MPGVPDVETERPMSATSQRAVIVVHGGAGVPLPQLLDDEQRVAALRGLNQALRSAHELLADGGSALDAVELAVRTMEDDPAFNAGVGAALTRDGHAEHEAAIMDGRSGLAGSVAGTRHIRNPVRLARAVMEHSPHVCLMGQGAEAFAQQVGFELVDGSIFVTPRRLQALRRVQAHAPVAEPLDEADRHGTVGAVAVDVRGHVAAATSTGGLTDKLPGRLGDSPVIGAGTYACDATCAISATGHGEYFMRLVFAHRIASLIELGGFSLEQAAERAMDALVLAGGSGGLIGATRDGRITLRFNGAGMYRGSWRVGEATPFVAIY